MPVKSESRRHVCPISFLSLFHPSFFIPHFFDSPCITPLHFFLIPPRLSDSLSPFWDKLFRPAA